MQIALKQNDIEAALRQYITQQGINTAGKTVAIAFVAGRKAGGLTATVSIEDSAVVSSTVTAADTLVASTAPVTLVETAAAPAAQVSAGAGTTLTTSTEAPASLVASVTEAAAPTAAVEAVNTPAAAPATEAAKTEAPAAEVKPTTSLFGN